MADERGKHHSGQHLKIRHLAREYPTATSAEIGAAVYEAPAHIRTILNRSGGYDIQENEYRAGHGLPASPDGKLISIMRKRVEVSQ